MTPEMLEEYLDGSLDAAGNAGLEQAVAGDPVASALLAKLRRQREIRAAAFASYLPSAGEASGLAGRVMAEAHAPLFKIGPSIIRWTSGIAAGLLLMGVAFGVGRMTAPAQKETVLMPTETVRTEYQVVYVDKSGDMQQHTFQTAEDRDNFVAELEAGGTSVIAVADLNPAGHM